MDTLHEMGIQRWRLRSDSVVDSDNEILPLAENAGANSAEIDSQMLGVDAAADASLSSAEQALVAETETQVTESNSVVEASDTFEANEVTQDSLSAELEPEALVEPVASQATWGGLAAALSENPSCGSCAQSNPILGEGNIEADFMLVVDAPSARDIQEQSLVAGRQGQLLDAILAAIGLDREKIYLSSVFKCPPSADLAISAACGQIVHDQIGLVKPKVLLTMGEFASQSLLRANEDLAQLQVKEHRYPNSIKLHDCKVICTHSLAEIIDKPMLKRQVWEDLKQYLNGV